MLGPEQAQAGGEAFVLIGELGGHVFAAVAAMGDELLEQQFALFQIEHPQALFGRRQGVIDHC
ncbi:hypothetical protein D3C86_1930890 [compost metagenome]